MSAIDWLPFEALGYGWSAIAVYGLWGLIPLAALVLLFDRYYVYRARARELEAKRPTRLTRRGPVVLRGRVMAEPSEAPAIELSIRQLGSEQRAKNNQYSHRWTEESRALVAQPFQVELEGGQLVDVLAEPTHLRLYADLDPGRYAGQDRRVRTAEIRGGDTVTLIGLGEPQQPGGVYRGSPTATLRAPPLGRLLVSTLPLSAPTARWRTFYGMYALGLAAAMLLVHAVAFGSYHLLALRGVARQAEVSGFDTYTTHTKSGTTTHFRVSARYDDPVTGQRQAYRADTSEVAYASLAHRRQAPFIVDAASPSRHQIGSRPHVNVMAMILGVLALGGGAALFFVTRRNYGAWYEREPYVQRGSGKLVQAPR